jgi:hypothetical protein
MFAFPSAILGRALARPRRNYAIITPHLRGARLNRFAQDNGVICRNMGETIAFCLPVVTA